ncbi:pyridoxal phosphate-dependent aminotransferase [Aurantibacillus circumpalustris]|uniref:pyridoxal phosphate-dependent aminotransferase n=1 Tax=Aurantibacillus circumpalustris TaxID=3036359 RepID=UPI00295B0888|nr:aminotransferase class I/II-fold pyridoxal phosphate-dependent enzyme [Aurantibacillus circumpalustris]
MKVSKIAENIIGSEIIKLAAEVNEKIKQGEKIFNLTIGDFNPKEFPIPSELKQYILEEYTNDQTNYPAADGMLELRQAVSKLLKERAGLDYKTDEILIAGGARPVIYCIFKALVDPEDTVLFATPSWNNNHYTYLNGAKSIVIEVSPEQNFMPTAADIKPHIEKISFIALCSPQNPTGTVFTKKGLEEICDLVLEENKKRPASQKPVYLMYDQIYWALTQDNIKHYDPVSLRPEMKNYTVFVDGVSKSLSATGVRVGWSMGPKFIIDKMKSILTHVGAWAPKAEQLACARYISELDKYDTFINAQKKKINARLDGLYQGLMQLKKEGFQVDAISPQAAIYLTVQFALHGQKTNDGKTLETTKDVTKYLLDEAKLAIVPFYAFGSADTSNWYRLSVGTCKLEDVEPIITNLRNALSRLKVLQELSKQ